MRYVVSSPPSPDHTCPDHSHCQTRHRAPSRSTPLTRAVRHRPRRRPAPHQSRPVRRHRQAQDDRREDRRRDPKGPGRGQERQGPDHDAEGPRDQVQHDADGDRGLREGHRGAGPEDLGQHRARAQCDIKGRKDGPAQVSEEGVMR